MHKELTSRPMVGSDGFLKLAAAERTAPRMTSVSTKRKDQAALLYM